VCAAAAAARDEKHTLAALGAAAALGYVERSGTQLPFVVPALGPAGTYGLAAWAIARFAKNKTAAHVATGLLACAARDLVRSSSLFGPTAQIQPMGPGGMVRGVEGEL